MLRATPFGGGRQGRPKKTMVDTEKNAAADDPSMNMMTIKTTVDGAMMLLVSPLVDVEDHRRMLIGDLRFLICRTKKYNHQYYHQNIWSVWGPETRRRPSDRGLQNIYLTMAACIR